MTWRNKNNKRFRVLVFVLAFIFLVAPFLFIDISTVTLQKYVEMGNITGGLFYILLLILSIVVAPFTMPLFFISGGIFGPQLAAIYNIIGWSIGAIIAFLIARYFNKSFLSRFGLMKKMKKYEQKIPKDMEFMSIILLRMVFPVDVLSYALGFFSNISFTRYTLSTIIGITPFAIIFAYGGSALFTGKYIMLSALILFILVAFGVGFYLLKRE